jgi:hypothetical protein
VVFKERSWILTRSLIRPMPIEADLVYHARGAFAWHDAKILPVKILRRITHEK